ncbi:hypothetical protein AVEN_88900-1 [Araneus ventricosus]|uniref:DDE-1 domain-containing protein n=1 Tax=Araneus ventricosus TaxID=182803 RepID=A0A4Y2M355_ARAVE|nr:hypothetical protein AVEN_88900-1 [Araneus ventricosus]
MKTLASENEAVDPGRKKMKDRATILGCANAYGSHRMKLTLLGKEVKKNLKKLKFKMAILLMDNAPVHPDVETLQDENITCIFMTPNTTAILQPVDKSVIESMERRYRI